MKQPTVKLSAYERAVNLLNELTPKQDRIICAALGGLREERDEARAEAARRLDELNAVQARSTLQLRGVERERDEWRAKWEALEIERAGCCAQMEQERDEARAELAAVRESNTDLRRESRLACIELADEFVPKAERAGAHLHGLPSLVRHAVEHHQWHHDAHDVEYVKRVEQERDEALDRLDTERHAHDETRGYRQHAEQERDEARAEVARLRTALRNARGEITRMATDGGGYSCSVIDEIDGALTGLVQP